MRELLGLYRKRIFYFAVVSIILSASFLITGLFPTFVVGLIIFCLSLCGFIKFPEYGVLALVLLYPFHYLVFTAPTSLPISISLPYADLLGVIFFYVWSLFFLRNKIQKKSEPIVQIAPGIFWVLLFAVIALFSARQTPDTLLGIKYILRPMLFGYFVYFVIPYDIIRTVREYKIIVLSLYSVAFGTALLSVLTSYAQSTGSFFRILPFSFGEWFPMGFNHNLLAEFLVPIIPLAVLIFFWLHKDIHRRLLVISVLFLQIISLLTLSRAAWLSFSFQLLIFAVYLYKKSTDTRRIIVVGLLSVLLAIPLLLYFGSFLHSSIVSSSNENRLLMVETARRVFSMAPVLGFGPGTFMRAEATLTDYSRLFGDPLDAHGLLLKLIVEVGLFGVLAYYALLVSLFKRIFQRIRRVYPANVSLSMYALAASAIGIFIFEQFNTSYFIGRFWFPIALVFIGMRLIDKNQLYEN